jgi:Zn-dependent protease with chaperone function
MVHSSEGSSSLADWGLAARPGRGPHLRIAALWTVISLAAALAVAVALSWWAGLAVVVGAVVALTAGPLLQLRRLVQRFDGVMAAAGSEPRLENLVRGLSGEHELVLPRTVVLEDAPPNACVWRPLVGMPVLAISRSYLGALSRTELEGVIAHCLVRLDSSDARAATMAGLLGAIGARIAPKVGFSDDIRAVFLTRYPPGLASAIQKAVPARGSAPLWFVADGPTHRAATERIEELGDL